MKAVLSWTLWPGTTAAATAAIVLALQVGPDSRAWETLAVSVILWGVVLGVLAAQRWLPLRADWSDWRGELGTDLLHATISAVAGATLARLVFFSAIDALSQRFGLRSGWPDDWSYVAQLALAIPISDLCVYGFHRACHAVPALWTLHEAHHSSRALYGLSSARAHPLYVALSTAASSGPLLLLGMDPPAFAVLSTFLGVMGLFQHANLDLRYGPLSLVFATADVHRWHHSAAPEEQATNFGNLLSVWDRLFGTFRFPPGVPATVGLRTPFPEGFVAHVLRPFVRSR